jgi:hypothetical protein
MERNSPGMWTTSADWTGGFAPLDASQHLKVMFNLAEAGPCTLDAAATVGHLVMGDNNSAADIRLTLGAGADLTAGLDAFGRTNWTAIGYNRTPPCPSEPERSCAAGIICGSASTLPQRETWTSTAEPSKSPDSSGSAGNTGTGFVTIRMGGSLKLDRIDPTRSISGDSSIDIQSGTIVIGGNQAAAINGYVSAGKITSYGGAGTVTATYDAGPNLTTVSSVAPLLRILFMDRGMGGKHRLPRRRSRRRRKQQLV